MGGKLSFPPPLGNRIFVRHVTLDAWDSPMLAALLSRPPSPSLSETLFLFICARVLCVCPGCALCVGYSGVSPITLVTVQPAPADRFILGLLAPHHYLGPHATLAYSPLKGGHEHVCVQTCPVGRRPG